MRAKLYWRIIAGLTILTFSIFVLSLFILVFTNLVLFAVTTLTVTSVIYAVWLLLTGVKKRFWLGVVLLIAAAFLFIIEVTLIFKRNIDRSYMLVTLISALLYLYLVRIVRQQYWRERRKSGSILHATPKFKRPILIINPKSGTGRAMKANVDKIAKEQGIQVIVTQPGDKFNEIAEREIKQGADVIGISGGDGSIGVMAAVAIKHNLPLVVLPGGTRCHFARDIGLDPEKITDSLAGFQGVERRVDVGKINDRIFLNNASFGVYADIVDHPEYREHKLATSQNVLKDLVSGKRKSYKLDFQDNEGNSYNQAVQLLVGVNAYESLKLFELGHRDSLDKGELQITAVTKLDDSTIRELLSSFTFKKYIGGSLPSNFVQWTGKRFTVNSPVKELVVGVDGEKETYKTPVRIDVLHKKLRLMVPAEVRSRPKSPLNPIMVRELWRIVTDSNDIIGGEDEKQNI